MHNDPRNSDLPTDDPRRPRSMLGHPEDLPPDRKGRLANGYRFDPRSGRFVRIWGHASAQEPAPRRPRRSS